MKSLFSLLILALFLTSCGSTQKIDKNELKKVKKVAVVLYSVPQTIDFRSDPKKEDDMSLMKAVAKAFTVGDGVKAAGISQKSFIHTINKSGKLPFKIVGCGKVKKNPALSKIVGTLNKKAAEAAAKKDKDNSGALGMMKMGLSFMGAGKKEVLASSPEGLASFGLVKEWGDGNALTGSKGESEYLDQALKSLGVDAILAVNDLGYSFSCKACIGGTGSASTGSAFHVSLIGKGQKHILDVNQWFSTTDFSTGVISGIVNPLSQDKMFKAHGKKMAEELIKQVLESLEEK